MGRKKTPSTEDVQRLGRQKRFSVAARKLLRLLRETSKWRGG